MTKDNIREYLLAKGRELVVSQGAAFLTARKLAEASGCSVGTIYNQFANMDNFIMAENLQTLDELAGSLRKLSPDSSAFVSALQSLSPKGTASMAALNDSEFEMTASRREADGGNASWLLMPQLRKSAVAPDIPAMRNAAGMMNFMYLLPDVGSVRGFLCRYLMYINRNTRAAVAARMTVAADEE